MDHGSTRVLKIFAEIKEEHGSTVIPIAGSRNLKFHAESAESTEEHESNVQDITEVKNSKEQYSRDSRTHRKSTVVQVLWQGVLIFESTRAPHGARKYN